jgi:glycosyltransferase involved in cell wall biosynthesis
LFPSFPENTRAREFWTSHLHAWRRDVAALLPSADVVHAGMCDVFRPMAYTGFLMGLQANKPTVFVQDTDQVLQMTELTVHAKPPQRAKQLAYCYLYERGTRFGVARAGLSLLKGRALHDRYGRYAKNNKNFHDTSYLTSEIVPQQVVQARVANLLAGARPLRLVYCGRLEARKGLADSIAAVAQARARGARVTFDIIGDGAERAALEQAVQRSGATDAVRFLGRRAYGPQLLADLGEYDALLFTPTAEDTPRMIFDGYAAGLPLVGYAIEYVRERDSEDRTVRSVPPRDISALSALLYELDRDRGQLATLAERAHEAALFHAADAWYKRRAEWTYEAVAAHRGGRS